MWSCSPQASRVGTATRGAQSSSSAVVEEAVHEAGPHHACDAAPSPCPHRAGEHQSPHPLRVARGEQQREGAARELHHPCPEMAREPAQERQVRTGAHQRAGEHHEWGAFTGLEADGRVPRHLDPAHLNTATARLQEREGCHAENVVRPARAGKQLGARREDKRPGSGRSLGEAASLPFPHLTEVVHAQC